MTANSIQDKPPFDPLVCFKTTLPPNPAWKPGQGKNAMVQTHTEGQEPVSYKLIEPGKTEIDGRMLYKIMLGGIVSTYRS